MIIHPEIILATCFAVLEVAAGCAGAFVAYRSRGQAGQRHQPYVNGSVNEYWKWKCRLCGLEWVGDPETMDLSGYCCVTDLEVSPASYEGSGLEVSP